MKQERGLQLGREIIDILMRSEEGQLKLLEGLTMALTDMVETAGNYPLPQYVKDYVDHTIHKLRSYGVPLQDAYALRMILVDRGCWKEQDGE